MIAILSHSVDYGAESADQRVGVDCSTPLR